MVMDTDTDMDIMAIIPPIIPHFSRAIHTCLLWQLAGGTKALHFR